MTYKMSSTSFSLHPSTHGLSPQDLHANVSVEEKKKKNYVGRDTTPYID